MSIFRSLGLHDPQSQMLWMRILLGLYSLITVWLGYRIVMRIAGKNAAIYTGLLLAFIAVLPNFSVRNLVEMACIPPLLGAVYLLQSNGGPQQTTTSYRKLVLAALLAGIAVGFRYQTVLMVAGMGIVVLLEQRFLRAAVFGITSGLAFFLTQADDIFLWGGTPFQHVFGYFGYNADNFAKYPGSPFAYLSFITYFILPPVSLFLLAGFLSNWKKKTLLVLPAVFFIVFHIIYPNRQERFLLPALPFFVMAGTIGWLTIVDLSSWWKKHSNLLRGLNTAFWTINLAAMLVMCFIYGKKARVETMSYLYAQGDLSNFIQEFSHTKDAAMLPQHYSGKWQTYYTLRSYTDKAKIIGSMRENATKTEGDIHDIPLPNYLIFMDNDSLQARVDTMKMYFPTLRPCTTFTSGRFDQLLHRLNPINRVETIHIYKFEYP
ncbi:MAG: glycosyltransferase family 39 protein, partial [Flavobacteriales bacterium]|nr:glycosyltransferase family 39 protein [Flavobacteriales bacterium]